MGNDVVLSVEMFTRIIEGQARVESKIDAMSGLEARVRSLEETKNEQVGMSKAAAFVCSLFSGGIGSALTWAAQHIK